MSTKHFFIMKFQHTLLLILFFYAENYYAVNYYVSPYGSDKNDGSITHPWQSIQHGCNALQAGDTLFIRNGLYRIKSGIRISNQGTQQKPVVITSFPGEKPVIDAKEFTTSNGKNVSQLHTGSIHIEDAAWVVIQGVQVNNSRSIGILVRDTTTHHIEIKRCKTDESYGSGIALWYPKHSKVLACEIVRANNLNMRVDGTPLRREAPHEALTIAGATNFEVAYNKLHLCFKEGIDCKEVSASGVIHHNIIHNMLRQGLYIDCWFGLLHDVEVHSNIVYACEFGMAISGEGKGASMQNIRIHHNLFYNNRASGLFFGVWGHDVLRKDIEIYNNTIYNNGTLGHWAGITGGIDLRSKNIENVYIHHNICSNNRCFEIAGFAKPPNAEKNYAKQNITIENNLITNNQNMKQDKGLFPEVYAYPGKNVLIAHPGFANPENGNFYLQPFSPALPSGTKQNNFIGAFGVEMR